MLVMCPLWVLPSQLSLLQAVKLQHSEGPLPRCPPHPLRPSDPPQTRPPPGQASPTQTQPGAPLLQAAPDCPAKPLGCQAQNSPLRSFQSSLLSRSPRSSSPTSILQQTFRQLFMEPLPCARFWSVPNSSPISPGSESCSSARLLHHLPLLPGRALSIQLLSPDWKARPDRYTR